MIQDVRIGHGYDVHQLVTGRPLVLGGITIPFEKGLLGHSDADIVIHAIIDALLGALALGSIGEHFPDTDPKYKNCDSFHLLTHVMELIHSYEYGIGNVDVTVVAERPKLKPYILQMRQRLSDGLQCKVDDVSIKATTSEKMGFVGNEDGLAAYAVVLLKR